MTQEAPSSGGPPAPAPPTDPVALLKTRSYLGLLFMGALVGVPVALAAYYFLKWVNVSQKWVFTTLPSELGFHGTPPWWPLLPLAVSGVVVAFSIEVLPGRRGTSRPKDSRRAGSSNPSTCTESCWPRSPR